MKSNPNFVRCEDQPGKNPQFKAPCPHCNKIVHLRFNQYGVLERKPDSCPHFSHFVACGSAGHYFDFSRHLHAAGTHSG